MLRVHALAPATTRIRLVAIHSALRGARDPKALPLATTSDVAALLHVITAGLAALDVFALAVPITSRVGDDGDAVLWNNDTATWH